MFASGTIPANVSLEATGDPAQNMQGGRCGAIS
jgi:hypothetical protein